MPNSPTTPLSDRAAELEAAAAGASAAASNLDDAARTAHAAVIEAEEALGQALARAYRADDAEAAAHVEAEMLPKIAEARAHAAEPWEARARGARGAAEAARHAHQAFLAVNRAGIIEELTPRAHEVHEKALAAARAFLDAMHEYRAVAAQVEALPGLKVPNETLSATAYAGVEAMMTTLEHSKAVWTPGNNIGFYPPLPRDEEVDEITAKSYEFITAGEGDALL